MAVRPIARMGAEVLKQRAQEVTNLADPELKTLIADMMDTMVAVHGVGLAAPQIYVPKRVVIFFVPAARNNGVEIPLTVMINPVITPVSDDRHEDWEACLSVPGLTGRVPRWWAINYSYQLPTGEIMEVPAHGFHARVVQHECDHLDGMLYPLRMTDLGTLSYIDAARAEAEARGETFDVDEEGEFDIDEGDGDMPNTKESVAV
ncbi:MAG: peptide deformylase [Rhodospirillaceae bacterium]|nr:peptide deformylase [Rhodospirillaceae bacterium]